MATQGAPAGWQEDFRSIGGAKKNVGIIFVHGFTGAPASMRPWANWFSDQGYTVSVPRLPGHATQWQDLNKVSWREWPAKVDAELVWLRSSAVNCEKVFIFGLSMGGCTTLNVAERSRVDGIVLVNPMIHIADPKIHIAPLLALVQKGRASVGDDIKKPGVTEWGYDVLPTKGVVQLNKMLNATRKALSAQLAPTLLFHSVDDHVLPVTNTEIIMAGLGASDKVRFELHDSYHVATLDNDQQIIFDESLTFVKRLS